MPSISDLQWHSRCFTSVAQDRAEGSLLNEPHGEAFAQHFNHTAGPQMLYLWFQIKQTAVHSMSLMSEHMPSTSDLQRHSRCFTTASTDMTAGFRLTKPPGGAYAQHFNHTAGPQMLYLWFQIKQTAVHSMSLMSEHMPSTSDLQRHSRCFTTASTDMTAGFRLTKPPGGAYAQHFRFAAAHKMLEPPFKAAGSAHSNVESHGGACVQLSISAA